MMVDPFSQSSGPWSFVQVRTTAAGTVDVLAAPGAGFQYLVRAYRVIGSGAGTVSLVDNAGTPKTLLAVSDVGAFEAHFGPFDNVRTGDNLKLQVVTTGVVNLTHQVWYRKVATNTL